MRINTNISSLYAQEATKRTERSAQSSLEKISSGLAINNASDDASGLAIADKLRTQASSLTQAIENSNAAITMIRIADTALGEGTNILATIKAKLIQASSATASPSAQQAVGKDIEKLLEQINNTAKEINYNGTFLLQRGAGDTAAAAANVFHVGEFSGSTVTSGAGVQANLEGLGLKALESAAAGGAGSFVEDVVGANSQTTNATNARTFLDKVDSAIDTINRWRSNFGSVQNQIESGIVTLGATVVNIKAAESVIRDVDYAAESANFNKHNIMAQAGTYAISQASALQQNVMRLLQ